MTRLQRHSLLGFLADPFGKLATTLEIDQGCLRIIQHGQPSMLSFRCLLSSPLTQKGLFGMTLIIAAEGREDVIMKGLKYHEARVVCEELKE